MAKYISFCDIDDAHAGKDTEDAQIDWPVDDVPSDGEPVYGSTGQGTTKNATPDPNKLFKRPGVEAGYKKPVPPVKQHTAKR